MDKLENYRNKRDFSVTPEPRGRSRAKRLGQRPPLAYIVQKHDARRLHYDFRLELDGVLLSWAVPKGPSVLPTEKRLAVRTEDHPLEYVDFEGIIPEGEYGGGTVMLWDKGVWLPDGNPRQSLEKGRLTFDLRGERLNGRYHLVKTAARPGDKSESWLLFKGRDGLARDSGSKELALTERTSVTTGRTMEEIREARDRTWTSKGEAGAVPRAKSKSRRQYVTAIGPPERTMPADVNISALVRQIPTQVEFTNLDKVLYPEQGMRKAALVAYYAVVSDVLLTHVARRPLTLVRCPDGPHKQCFFQKHLKDLKVPFLRALPILEENGQAEDYIVVDDRDGLYATAQLGALELHTWASREPTIEKPDMLVLDLDPDPSVSFDRVVDAAFVTRSLLERLDLECWVKTTGGKGLHVCVPVRPHIVFEEAKAFTKLIAEIVVASAPEQYTINPRKARRRGRIFIDYLRNGRGATAIAPYSTRARPNATVATPVTWDELKKGIDPQAFTVRTVPSRLDRQKDPFASMSRAKQSVTKAIRRRAEELLRESLVFRTKKEA